MFRFVVLSLCVALIWASPKGYSRKVRLNSLTSRIINGDQAVLGQFPYEAALYINQGQYSGFCGGSIISREWILTAGHCVDGAKFAQVLAGLVDLHSGGTYAETFYFVLHENYDAFTLSNDIGLAKLDTPLTFDKNVAAISLASDTLGAGIAVTVIGWGITNDGGTAVSNYLNYINLVTISNAECRISYGEVIVDDIVCAVCNSTRVQSPCSGDSGGPLVVNADTNPLHVGLVSFIGNQGCEVRQPSGYTRTAYFRSWIRQKSGV